MPLKCGATPIRTGRLIRRTHDASFLNEVANHPDVRPWLGPGSSTVDMSPEVGDPRNFAFQTDGGGLCFLDRDGGTYEVHCHFLPDVWGVEPRAALQEALGYMFAEVCAEEIVVQIPDHNHRAERFWIGAGFRYRRPSGHVWADGSVTHDIGLYGLTRDEWCEVDQCPG